MKKKRQQRKPVSRQAALQRIADDDLRAAAGAGPTESVSLGYGHVEWTYTKQKPDGTGGGNVTAKYDLVKAKGA